MSIYIVLPVINGLHSTIDIDESILKTFFSQTKQRHLHCNVWHMHNDAATKHSCMDHYWSALLTIRLRIHMLVCDIFISNGIHYIAVLFLYLRDLWRLVSQSTAILYNNKKYF